MKLQSALQDSDFLEWQQGQYESLINDILEKVKNSGDLEDCDFNDHLCVLEEAKIIYSGSDWKPFPHPDLPSRKNYTKDLVNKYMEGIVVKRNKAKNEDETRTNILRRGVTLDSVEEMIKITHTKITDLVTHTERMAIQLAEQKK